VLVSILNIEKFLSLFEGLPVFSKYTHSATTRIDDFMNTWKIFIKSPIEGYSLGGVAPAIAKLKGYTPITQEIVKKNEGMCIFLEVLAASGIIGFIFFAIFIIKFLVSPWILRRLINKRLISTDPAFYKMHYILVLTVVFQMLLLCLNQNILRNYLWVHLAIINLSFFSLKYHLQSNYTRNES
jgi:O-antigen ligase